MPQDLRHEPDEQRLWIGSGCIAPVPPSTREYQVSGMNVLDKWFGYRRKKPAGKRRLELDHVVARRWSPDWTSELLTLLNILGLLVQEEPAQRELLETVCSGPLISVRDLAEGAFSRCHGRHSSPSHPPLGETQCRGCDAWGRAPVLCHQRAAVHLLDEDTRCGRRDVLSDGRLSAMTRRNVGRPRMVTTVSRRSWIRERAARRAIGCPILSGPSE